MGTLEPKRGRLGAVRAGGLLAVHHRGHSVHARGESLFASAVIITAVRDRLSVVGALAGNSGLISG